MSPLQESVQMDHPFVKSVICEGSPYEIGYTHGINASTEVHNNIATYTFFFAETAKMTWEEARKRATAQLVTTLRACYPEILEEMRGIAEGAGKGLTMNDILALNVRSEIALTNYSDGCTALAQKGANGEMFLVQNWDWLEELQKGMVFLHMTPAGEDVKMIFLSEAGLVGKIGMNSHGVGLCTNALRSGSINTTSLPVHVMHRKILQTARSYDEAVALIEQYGLACTVNYVLADSSGNFGNIEASPLGNRITTS